MPAHSDRDTGRSASFNSTIWPVVLSAAQEGTPEGRAALAELCRVYWQPTCSFIRRQGYDQHDAEDLVQEFFLHLIENQTVGRAERERGRFRSFLLGALTRFLANETARRRALKRGHGATFVYLDAGDPESRGALEPACAVASPAEIADGRRARRILGATLSRLKTEFVLEGKARTFELLQEFLPGATESVDSYQTVATQLGLSVSALKSLIHRSRERYRALLRREVGHEIGTSRDVDEEIRQICATAGFEQVGDETN